MFVHTTSVPTATVTSPGEKLKLEISIATGAVAEDPAGASVAPEAAGGAEAGGGADPLAAGATVVTGAGVDTGPSVAIARLNAKAPTATVMTAATVAMIVGRSMADYS